MTRTRLLPTIFGNDTLANSGSADCAYKRDDLCYRCALLVALEPEDVGPVDGSKLLRRRVRLCRFGLSAIVLEIGLLPVLLAGLGHVQDAGGGGKAEEEAGKAPWEVEMLAAEIPAAGRARASLRFKAGMSRASVRTRSHLGECSRRSLG